MLLIIFYIIYSIVFEISVKLQTILLNKIYKLMCFNVTFLITPDIDLSNLVLRSYWINMLFSIYTHIINIYLCNSPLKLKFKILQYRVFTYYNLILDNICVCVCLCSCVSEKTYLRSQASLRGPHSQWDISIRPSLWLNRSRDLRVMASSQLPFCI